MAQKKEIINLQVKYGSLDGLNKALDETKKKLSGTNINSDQFKKLSKEVRGLENEIEKVGTKISGIDDKKFMAINGAVKTAAGALTGFTGALGLAGVESEKLGKFQEQAASAIALGMGAKDVAEGLTEMAKSGKIARIATKALSAATKVMTGVQKGFNAVMAMNPLGILIVGLTTVGVLIYKFRDQIMEAIKSFIPFGSLVEKVTGFFNDMAVAIGLADSEQEKAIKKRIEGYEQEVKLAQARGENTLELEKKIILAKQKLEEKGSEAYIALKKEEEVQNQKIRTDKKKADETAAKEKEAADKAAYEKKKAADEKELAEQQARDQKAVDLLISLQQKELDMKAETDQQKLDLEQKRLLAEIDLMKVSDEQKNALRLQAEENYGIQLQALKEKQAQEDLEKTIEREQAEKDRQLELQALQAETDIEKRNAEVMVVEEQYNRLIEAAKKNGEDTTTLEKIKAAKIKQIDDDSTAKKIANAEAESAMKEQAMNQSVDAIQGALTNLFGESKAIASANVLVDAGQAAVGIIKSSTSIPAPFNIPFQVAQFALLATTTMGSLKQINSAAPGKGGSPQRPSAGGGGRSAVQAPQAPQAFDAPQTTTVQPVVKAYVVSGDTRTAMEAEAKINSRRSLAN